LPLGAGWLLRKSLLWKRESLRDGLSRAAQRARKCLGANGTAASVAVHKQFQSRSLERNGKDKTFTADRKTKILPLMTLIALISAESGNEIYRKGRRGRNGTENCRNCTCLERLKGTKNFCVAPAGAHILN
jgi:hypothetical protein